jgi:hypothetical protein
MLCCLFIVQTHLEYNIKWLCKTCFLFYYEFSFQKKASDDFLHNNPNFASISVTYYSNSSLCTVLIFKVFPLTCKLGASKRVY